MGKIASENLKNALINQFDPETRESEAVYRVRVRAVRVRTPGKLFVFGLPGTG